MADPKLSHVDRVLEAVQSRQEAAISPLAASWCRSALHHGLDPAREARRDRLGSAEIDRLRESHGELLHVAGPVLDALFRNVGLTGCCVILTDADGIVLESRSTAADVSTFNSIGLVPGANWSEAAEGTNGIGTCLVERRPVTIHRDEHFASRNIGVSCMDAPVFDPEGRVVAAVDASSGRSDHGEAVARLVSALVQDAARQIERDFFCHRYADARIVYSPDQSGGGSALFAVDKDDLVIGASRAARQHYGLSETHFETPHPLADIIGTSGPSGFEEGERAILRQALARSGGNVAAAARALGIGRATIYRRMERVGLSADR